jgi:hypothetical protein
VQDEAKPSDIRRLTWTQKNNVGLMAFKYLFCDALLIKDEEESMCCGRGKVVLDRINNPPLPLKHLFDGTSPHSKAFRTNMRYCNYAFAFTSLGVQIDERVQLGVYNFRIHGEMYYQNPRSSQSFTRFSFVIAMNNWIIDTMLWMEWMKILR